MSFYLAQRKASVPAELHIFENAPHGVGVDLAAPSVGEWSTLLLHWFRERKLVFFSRALTALFGCISSLCFAFWPHGLLSKKRRGSAWMLPRPTQLLDAAKSDTALTI
jgi:hypothetical protein